jgi:simple sugar transport system permease protein
MGISGIILNYSLLFATILMAGALAGYLSERVGIVNIGIDGMMCFGAIFFAIFSSPVLKMSTYGPGMFIFPLLLTMMFTTIAGLMHAFVTIKLKANHIISGTAINLIGVALASFLNAPLGAALYHSSRLASGFGDFLYIGNSIYGSSIIMFILIAIIATAIYVVMQYTRVGLRFRAVGENPNAVDAQGINVNKYQ